MRRRGTLALAFAGALAMAGCGGGGGGSTPTSPSPGGGSNGGGNIVTITIKGVNGKQSFDPNPATVAAGQLVVFKNTDVVAHDPTMDGVSGVTTGAIQPGATSQPMAIGTAKTYHCGIHPSMVGSFNGNETPEPPPCTGYCG